MIQIVQSIQLDNAGVKFIVTMTDGNCPSRPVDISDGSTLKIIFKKPDDTLEPRTATFLTNGKDGQITYTSVATDFDTVGDWKLQGHVVGPGYDIKSHEGSFPVRANL